MGGSVKVVIRFKDGKVKCQTRHTNALPYWFNQNYDFIIEPEKVCKEYISKNKESGYYVSGATNSPDGYGIVVIDLLKNEIISCQGYTEFNFLHSGSLAVSMSLYISFSCLIAIFCVFRLAMHYIYCIQTICFSIKDFRAS